MRFWYWRAVDGQSRRHWGVSKGREKAGVIAELRMLNLYPVRLNKMLFTPLWVCFYSRRAVGYWARTARKMETLLRAGIPLLQVLDILAAKETGSFRKNQWQDVILKIKNGGELSASLKDFIPTPGPFARAMILAGERSGTLLTCLHEIAEQMQEEAAFAKKIKAALVYPSLLLAVALIVVYTLSSVVLPMYAGLFQGLEAELPFITRLLLLFGSGIPYAVIFFGLFLLLSFVLKKSRPIIFPGTKKIEKYRALQRFCTLLARLLDAGIPLLEAVSLLKQVPANKEMRFLLEGMKRAVQEGKRITPVLAESTYFPLEEARMLEMAEESGRLSAMLTVVGRSFRRELEEKLELFPKMLEPLLVLGMAALVGLVAIGVLLPIFQISTAIR